MNSDTKGPLRTSFAAPNRFAGIAQVLISFCQPPEPRANRRRLISGSLLLLTLVLAVYRPILPGNFLMDDTRLIEGDNPLVNGQLTPVNVWFQTDFTLATFALWLQHLAWGNNPGWYHLVNLLLHATSAVLLWRLLAKLKIPGAWLAAALFAIHPVCVNSVARVAEIKNTLSLPFFLLSFFAYLHYESLALFPSGENPGNHLGGRRRATFWYAFALLTFIAALMSKTSTIMLPVILLACAVWQRRQLERKDWLHTAPFFALSLAFGLMSVWFQKNQALFSAGETPAPENFWQRLAVAGHVLGFYLGKALLPVNLNLVYPRWKLAATSIISYLPHLLFCAALILCWRFRRTWGRHVLFALGCFAVALFPALGFFDSQFLTRWQVSDHLQYLPLIAPVALAATWLGAARHKKFSQLAAVVVLLGISVLAFQRASVFVSDETLLRDSIAKNPDASMAHGDLGVILAQRNDLAGAISHFEAALQSDSNNVDAHVNLGHALAVTGKLPDAEKQFQAALKLKPYQVDAHKNFAELLQHEGRNREAIFHYQVAVTFKPDTQTRLNLAELCYQTGDAHQAITQFYKVLQIEPNNIETLNNLAWLLATCGDESARNASEAVRCAEKACALTGYKQARTTGTLAAAYAEAGRYADAVAIGNTTVKLANDAGDQSITYVGNQLLRLYRNNQPYHEPVAANTGNQ